MRTLSSMIAEVRSQTDEVRGAVERLRTANRHMTGNTGESPTPIGSVNAKALADRAEVPIMDELNSALEHLNSATADLRAELMHMEGYTETGAPGDANKGYATAAQGQANNYR